MFRVANLLLIVKILVNLSSCEKINYDDYKLYSVTPKNNEQIGTLKKFHATSGKLKILNEIRDIGVPLSILVPPTMDSEFVSVLQKEKIPYELQQNNFQKLLNDEIVPVKSRAHGKAGRYDWSSYHSLDATYEWLKSLAKEFPTKVKVITGGTTYEHRKILGVKVSFKRGNKGVFLEGGIHAREWISPATVTYILNEILRNPEPSVRHTVEQFDWYVFPHFNPDGYVYTHTIDRLWRKTRSKQAAGCYGTDPNRNWNFHWNEVGASDDPCEEDFAGKFAFSEIETKTLSKFLTGLKGKIHTYLSFHSYSQLLLFPYGHTKELTPNHKDLMKIGKVAVAALSKRYKTKYKVGNTYSAIYPSAGGSDDWVYGVLGVKIGYTYELRPGVDRSTSFVLPPKQIIPTGQETFDSVLALLRAAKGLRYYD